MQNVAPGPGTAVFSPDSSVGSEFSTMAFACYRMQATGFAGVAEVTTYFDPAPEEGNSWLGVANFSTNRWDWFERGTVGPTSFGQVAEHCSITGEVFVVVVVLGKAQAELKLLRLGQADICGELIQTPQAGVAPLTKEFDPAALYVEGDLILGINWDFDNDGITDDTGLGVHSHYYPSDGKFPLRLTVQTELGDEISASFPVPILQGSWDCQPVAAPADGLHHFTSPKLALVNGSPMLAYIHTFDGDPPAAPAFQTVELISAEDRLASTWLPGMQPKPGDKHYRLYGLVEAAGLPVLLLANDLGGFLQHPALLYALEPSLSNWATLTFADSIHGIEREAGLAMVGGNLSLCYRDSIDRVIFAQCSGGDISTMSPIKNTGWDCNGTLSLANVNGFPAIATSRFSGVQQVVYLLSSSPAGDAGTWFSCYSEASHTQTPALGYTGVSPILAADGANDFLVAIGDAPDGQAGLWRTSTPAASNGLGDWCQVAGPCLDGLACVASQNEQDLSLGFALIKDDGVNLSAVLDTIDNEAGMDLGRHCDLLIVDGVPIVAYEDTTSQSIKVAVLR